MVIDCQGVIAEFYIIKSSRLLNVKTMKFNIPLNGAHAKLLVVVLCLFPAVPKLYGQEASEVAAAAKNLADELANPVSSLISAPFQSNMDFGLGPNFGSRYTLNIQPVVPVSINDRVHFIGRVVLPFISQYNVTGIGESQTGLSDATITGFFSPKRIKHGFIWGAGPAFLLPTATIDALASKKLGLGPSLVALMQTGGITFGLLVNQIWSILGNTDRPDLNQLFFQPYIVHNWPTGTGVGATLEGIHYWNSKSTNIWLTATLNSVSLIKKQKIQWQIGPRFNIAAPEGSRGKFGFRASLTFLFPT